ATSGVCKPATSAGRVRQEFTAAARRVRRAQLRALLRDGRDAALPPPRTGQHLEAAVGSCRRVQPEPDSAPVAGCGHAARAEKPLWHACFVRLSTLPGSDKSESALQKPDLRVRCQVLREFAYPATSPAVQKIRYLHHGLLRHETQDYPDTVLQPVRTYQSVQAAWAIHRMFRLQPNFCEVQDVEDRYGSRAR